MAAIAAVTTDRSLISARALRSRTSGSLTTGSERGGGGVEWDRVPRWARVEPGPTSTPTPPVGRRRERAESVFRRRRLVAAVLLALVAFAAGVALAIVVLSAPAGGSLTDTAEAEDLAARQTRHVVDLGDTLWTVAHRVAPDEDPRVVVDALADARGGSTVMPGDVIRWPLE